MSLPSGASEAVARAAKAAGGARGSEARAGAVGVRLQRHETQTRPDPEHRQAKAGSTETTATLQQGHLQTSAGASRRQDTEAVPTDASSF